MTHEGEPNSIIIIPDKFPKVFKMMDFRGKKSPSNGFKMSEIFIFWQPIELARNPSSLFLKRLNTRRLSKSVAETASRGKIYINRDIQRDKHRLT